MANTNITPGTMRKLIPGGSVNQRLGLHVTEDELAIWQARMTDNVGSIGGVTYQTMYNSLIDANFTSSSVGNWDPGPGTGGTWTGSVNFPDNQGGSDNTHSPSFDQGKAMLHAAFVAMVENNSTLGTRVRDFLLNHANRSTLDFTNATAWNVNNYDGVMIRVATFLNKCLFAYDYIRIGGFITGANRTTVETWLNGAGQWLMAKTDFQVSQNAFPNRLSESYGSCTGGQCGAGTIGRLYGGGPLVYGVTETWSNRIANALTFFSAAANPVDPVITWDSNFGPRAKRFVEEFLQFSTWNNGSCHELYRWVDGGTADEAVGSSWTHVTYQYGPCFAAADHLARAGDSELYDYTTQNGFENVTSGPAVSGQEGPPDKTLLLIAKRMADFALGNVTVHGHLTDTTGNYRLRPTVEGGHGEDYIAVMSNLFWDDALVKSMYTASRTVTSSCGGFS